MVLNIQLISTLRLLIRMQCCHHFVGLLVESTPASNHWNGTNPVRTSQPQLRELRLAGGQGTWRHADIITGAFIHLSVVHLSRESQSGTTSTSKLNTINIENKLHHQQDQPKKIHTFALWTGGTGRWIILSSQQTPLGRIIPPSRSTYLLGHGTSRPAYQEGHNKRKPLEEPQMFSICLC